MSQSLTMAQSNSLAFRQKLEARNKPVRVGRVTFNFLLAVLICAGGIFYIFEVNNVATQGFQIRDLEKKVQELKESNEKLKIREAELRSMYNIEGRTKDLNMTTPENITYLNLPGNMAMK